jgi:NitT/TauT family transport system substrate-binding protein
LKYMTSTTTADNWLNRRQFLRSAATFGLSAGGLALLAGCASQPAAPGVATETLETTSIRLIQSPSICVAPLYVAEDLLKAEGFTQVQYVNIPGGNLVQALAARQVDMGMQFSGPMISSVDVGLPLTVLAGVHVGCYVLFTREPINSVSALKGKTVATVTLGDPGHAFLSSMLAYIGMNPTTDINWVFLPRPEAQQRFTDGQVDGLIAFPPVVQELQAKKIGHAVVSSMSDKPWSDYFCCMVAGRQEFVQNNPVATKRALSAILKATDIIARDPERGAKLVVDRGLTKNYDYALKALQELPYNTWREYDPTDTLRFFSLRLRDAGMVKSSPDEIIARGTDWRFLNELKKELPAPAPSANIGGLFCRVGGPS